MIIPVVRGSQNRRVDKSGRPRVRPEMTPADWLLEALAFLGLLVFAGYVIYHYRRLPDIIPSHFNAAGMPDDYSGKATILGLPGSALFVYLLLTLIALVPHQFNFSVKITPENALKQYTMAIRLIRFLKLTIILVFFYITTDIVRESDGNGSGLGLWFLPVSLGFIFIPLIFYLIRARRNR
jgi:uncharacterized membrane protein